MHLNRCSDTTPSAGWENQPQSANTDSLLQGKRIIVVEDEGITQMQLHRILAHQRMQVIDAVTSGPEAVEAVLKGAPDVVLMDIQMPGEYDGLEAARRILAVRDVCIIMLTAFSDESHRDEAERIGVCGYVVKPIDHETLVPQLTAALEAYLRN